MKATIIALTLTLVSLTSVPLGSEGLGTDVEVQKVLAPEEESNAEITGYIMEVSNLGAPPTFLYLNANILSDIDREEYANLSRAELTRELSHLWSEYYGDPLPAGTVRVLGAITL